jgi:hypothetical protein
MAMLLSPFGGLIVGTLIALVLWALMIGALLWLWRD